MQIPPLTLLGCVRIGMLAHSDAVILYSKVTPYVVDLTFSHDHWLVQASLA